MSTIRKLKYVLALSRSRRDPPLRQLAPSRVLRGVGIQRYCQSMDTGSPATDWAADQAANARFFRVLGDPTRLAILERLLDRPHSVSELTVALRIAQSRVSNHLA